jgi:hypothetical protein
MNHLDSVREMSMVSCFYILITNALYSSKPDLENKILREINEILINKLQSSEKKFSKFYLRLKNLFQTNQISREDSVAYLFSLLSKETDFIENGTFLIKEILANGLIHEGGLNSLSNAMSNLRNFIGMNLFEI